LVVTKARKTLRRKMVAREFEHDTELSEMELDARAKYVTKGTSSLKRLLMLAKEHPYDLGKAFRHNARRFGFLLKDYIAFFVRNCDLSEFVRGLGPNVWEFMEGLGDRKNLIYGFHTNYNPLIVRIQYPGYKLHDFFMGLDIYTKEFAEKVNAKEFGEYLVNASSSTYDFPDQVFLDFVTGLLDQKENFIKGLGQERLKEFHKAISPKARVFAQKMKNAKYSKELIKQFTGIDL